MKYRTPFFVTLSITLLYANPTAALTMSQEILRCDAIQSRVEKLECFEQLADVVANSRVVSIPIERLDEPNTPLNRRTRNEDIHEFGLESQKKEKMVQASIAVVRKLNRGQFELTLDNEQIWRELEASNRSAYVPGQLVTIERTFIGSYRMRVADSGFVARVKRIK